MTKEEVLQQCAVEGNIIKIPQQQLDRNVYIEVKKTFELIGGKWKGGNVWGFVFPTDPTELLAQVANGVHRNLKKEFQFFATPPKLADKLVSMANIASGDLILEPSAGQGAIVEAILRTGINDLQIIGVELMETNSMILDQKGFNHEKGDFLVIDRAPVYDIVIANPPFSKNQDIDHIMKMYECLNSRGTLVSIASKHWQLCDNKKETEFRDWLYERSADIEEIERGEFKESGTTVGGVIITIKKI